MTESDILPHLAKPKRLAFLLVEGFPLMAYAAVVESYRAANALSGQPLYEWAQISVDGAPCRASNGTLILADGAVGDPVACDLLFILAGGDPTRFADARTFAWLRQMATGDRVLVGVSGGAYVMARAGLLSGRRATIHWEYREAFLEHFPDTICEQGLFVFDGRRVTCAGGMAGMDLAVELIEREHGHALAAAVSDWFIRSQPRLADRPQRLSLRDRYDVANDRVLRALAAMEEAIEDPLARERLADLAGVSVRQLERLFAAHLGSSIAGAYLRIRLDHAEQLLRSTAMNTTMVAVACGFTNLSHFSRVFRRHFGRSPSAARRSRREAAAGTGAASS